MDDDLSLYKCSACDTLYADPGADGVVFFHVCPPLPLRDLAGAQLARALGGTPVLRPGHRDERPRDTLRDSLDGERSMVGGLAAPQLEGRVLVKE
jgi:hypothetical protein